MNSDRSTPLTVLQQSGPPTFDAMFRAARRADRLLALTVAEETTLGGAALFTNAQRPAVACANYAADLRVPEGSSAAAVVEEIGAEADRKGLSPHAMEAAGPSWPAELAREIERFGYQPTIVHTHHLGHQTLARPGSASLQIIPARSAYSQLRAYYHAAALDSQNDKNPPPDGLTESLIDHLDEPKLDLYAGRVDGEVRRVGGVVSLGEIGVVYRAAGLVCGDDRSMMDHVLSVCGRAGLKQVIVELDDNDGSTPFYESIGFARIGSFTRYVKASTGSAFAGFGR